MTASGPYSSGRSIAKVRSIRYSCRYRHLVVGPPHLSGGSARCGEGSAATTQRRTPMLIGLGFLALFSVLTIVFGNEDSRRDVDPGDQYALWTRFGIR